MLKIEKTRTLSPEQWEIVIEGMRQPMNSHHRMDSKIINANLVNEEVCPGINSLVYQPCEPYISIGPNDHDLMMRLANGGPVHAKYRRMIPVWVTITAPFYFYKELDTYKIGTVCNSASTMHKIHSKPITMDDFSFDEDLLEEEIEWFTDEPDPEDEDWANYTQFDMQIDTVVYVCESLRQMYLKTKDKKYWRMLIQFLPNSYNQTRTYFLNYEVLKNIYESRKDHKLTEWHTLCSWIEELPYSELIIGEQGDDE